jgi:inhibitor of KinA
MDLIAASDSSLLVVFGNVISPELHRRVLALLQAIQAQRDRRVRNLHPGYASLLIDFNPLQTTHEEMASRVRYLTSAASLASGRPATLLMVPVCYGGEFGPDVPAVASHAGTSEEEVVRLHSSATYLVYFLGFSPGFAYLGGLPEVLHTPRLATPRLRIAGGSVGIAGSQTGIYPLDSAGGWRLIGRTPLRMFDPGAMPPTRLQPGDRIKFEAISRAEFDTILRSD